MSPDSQTLSRDETRDLISSAKVEGTAVYGTNGEKIGSVDHFMVGKRDGRVRYAVMTFGGLFGMGESYHPLPWDQLTYKVEQGGYVVNLTQDQLKKSPQYGRDQDPTYDDDYMRQVDSYYGVSAGRAPLA